MSIDSRLDKLEGRFDGECQKCGLAHPVVVLTSEPAPSKCRSCGGPLFIVRVPNEHTRELVRRVVSGERTAKSSKAEIERNDEDATN